MLHKGAKVDGSYMGEPFTGGTVSIARWHSINPNAFVVHIEFDKPVMLYGMERRNICMTVNRDGGWDESVDRFDYGNRVRVATA